MKTQNKFSLNEAGTSESPRTNKPLQLGFVAVNDCAPLVFARESGLFEEYELQVELRRRARWADIRDGVISGDLDAAQAPASLPFLANVGLESDCCASVSGLVMSLQGNAIAVSRQLWNEGVRDASTLRRLVYRDWGKRTYTFGVVFPCAPPHFLLRQWFELGGVLPSEVRILVVPAAEMYPTLKLGYIDGFCAGEPWTSLAMEAGTAMCLATSAELAPLHPEKVLMVRRAFAEGRADEHERLIAALIEACAFCDRPENRPLLAEMLARPQYVNAPVDCVKDTLARNHNIFHRHNANDPTNEKAAWVIARLYELVENSVLKMPIAGRTPVLKNVFRRDIYRRALAAISNQANAIKRETADFACEMKRIA